MKKNGLIAIFTLLYLNIVSLLPASIFNNNYSDKKETLTASTNRH